MKKLLAAFLCLLCMAGCVKEANDIPTDPVSIPADPAIGIPGDEITCVAPVAPTDPVSMSGAPELTVFSSETEINALYGGHTWCTTMPDGTTAIICADSLHPLEMQKYLSVLTTSKNSAGLAFWDGKMQVLPGEIYVEAWDFDCNPDCDGIPYEVAVYSGGERIDLLPGKYIYIVNTKWGDGVTSGGSVTHVFCADRLYPNNE